MTEACWIPTSDTATRAARSVDSGDYDYLLDVHFLPKYALLAGLVNTFASSPAHPAVLDVGAGYPLLPTCGLRYGRYVALDHTDAFVKRMAVPDDGRSQYVVADFEQWVTESLFDVVVVAGLTNRHSHRPGAALRWVWKACECCRVGGIVVLESATISVRGYGHRPVLPMPLRLLTDCMLTMGAMPIHGSYRRVAVYERIDGEIISSVAEVAT